MTKNAQRKLICGFNLYKIIILTLVCSLLNTSVAADIKQDSISERYLQAKQLEKSDPYTAFAIYQDLVKQGDTESKVRLASFRLAGLGEGNQEERIKHALSLLNEAATKNSANAYFGLAVVYLSGQDVPPNVELGMASLMKAAEGGEPRAQNQLGNYYELGTFIAKDENKALYWYQKSAKQQNDMGLYNLALSYQTGLGDSPQDVDKAIQLFNQGIELNYTNAKRGLGNLYFNDNYGVKNENKAFYWLNQAAQEGDLSGKIGLASCYRYGVGTSIDNEKAFHWYQSAANSSGNPIPRFRIAEMYMEGLGTEKNLLEAKTLFVQLSAEGYADATTELNKINKILSKSE